MTREEKIAEVKKKLEKIREKRQLKREEARKTFTPPRYDDVYFEGLRYLDSLDCPPEFSKVVDEHFWELI